MTKHKKPLIKLSSIYQWHRYAGLIAAVFIIVIAVTGVLLNHSNGFKLNKIYIKTNWLLNYYGITAPKNINSYLVANNWVSQWDNRIYLNKKMILKNKTPVIGAVTYADMIIVAQQSTLFVFTLSGELIERVAGSEGLPSGIEAIGITDNKELAIRSSNGVFTGNQDFLFWQGSSSAIVVWSDNTSLPDSIHASLLEVYRGQGLKLGRILYDLHSGRIFGKLGIYFTDFIAFLMVWLAFSGIWLWGIRLFKKKKHHKQQFKVREN